MFERDRYAPPSGHRKPDLPSPQLVVPRLRMSRTGAIALAVHALIIALLFWHSAELLAGSGDGPGAPGGGGGGGLKAMHLFLLAGASAPRQVALPPVPAVAITKMPLPEPAKLDLPKLQPPAVQTQVVAATGTSNGTSGGPGEGPGSGGGKGAGAGPGVGNDSGPGSGGSGSYILPASPKLTIMPPTCFKGKTEAKFSIDAEGRVTGVELVPPPKNADCRDLMVRTFKDNLFTPAQFRLTRQPVASVLSMWFAH